MEERSWRATILAEYTSCVCMKSRRRALSIGQLSIRTIERKEFQAGNSCWPGVYGQHPYLGKQHRVDLRPQTLLGLAVYLGSSTAVSREGRRLNRKARSSNTPRAAERGLHHARIR